MKALRPPLLALACVLNAGAAAAADAPAGALEIPLAYITQKEKRLPPLSLGSVRLDLAFLVIMLVTGLAMSLVQAAAVSASS